MRYECRQLVQTMKCLKAFSTFSSNEQYAARIQKQSVYVFVYCVVYFHEALNWIVGAFELTFGESDAISE